MINILILCTGNSCRSQIAQAYFAHYTNAHFVTVYSAGIETHGVNPKAIATMKEDDIDIHSHTSNHIDEYRHIDFDFIITVCDNANEHCPIFISKAKKFHQNFPDPAKANGSDEEIQYAFSSVRNQIKEYVKIFVKTHLSPSAIKNI